MHVHAYIHRGAVAVYVHRGSTEGEAGEAGGYMILSSRLPRNMTICGMKPILKLDYRRNRIILLFY